MLGKVSLYIDVLRWDAFSLAVKVAIGLLNTDLSLLAQDFGGKRLAVRINLGNYYFGRRLLFFYFFIGLVFLCVTLNLIGLRALFVGDSFRDRIYTDLATKISAEERLTASNFLKI